MSSDEATACMANIGPHERKKRLVQGAVSLVVFLLAAAAMLFFVEVRWWRVTLTLPMLAAALGFFQAREQTCVRLAASGSRNLDDGEVVIRDVDFLTRTIEQAQRVWVKSILATVLIIAALLTLPPP